MVFKRIRNATGWPCQFRQFTVALCFGNLDSAFNVSNSLKVLGDFDPVIVPESFAEIGHFVDK